MAPAKLGEELRELLITAHLYYDIGTESLRLKAFADVITKILYLAENQSAKIKYLANRLEEIVGKGKISNQVLVEALEYLRKQSTVTRDGTQWVLTAETKQKISTDLDLAKGKISSIIDKYFKIEIDKKLLIKWFKEASASFFGKYGDIWAKTLYRKPLNLPQEPNYLNKVLAESIAKYNLSEHSDALISSFTVFLFDYQNPEVASQIWSFAQAVLSSKLITVASGPDPITLNEIKDSMFFLDTNVLFSAVLEDSSFAKSFKNFVKSLKAIGGKLCVSMETKNEYESKVKIVKKEILKAIKNGFSLEVIGESGDQFFNAAIARHCKNYEDFERFFDAISSCPQAIGDIRIELLDSPDLDLAVKKGTANQKRLREIELSWKGAHPDLKSKSFEAKWHDLALQSIAEFLRKSGKRVFIITRDRSMQSQSTKWSGSDFQTWTSLDILVQILALTGGRAFHEPENFAPLLARIIELDLQPNNNVFEIVDLNELYDVEERITSLSKEQSVHFAKQVAKDRISGMKKHHPDLQLKIRRTFQVEKMQKDEEIIKLKSQTLATERELEGVVNENTRLISILEKKLLPWVTFIEYLKLFSIYIVIFSIGIFFIFYGESAINSNQNFAYFFIGLGITEILIPIVLWLPKKIKETNLKITDKVKQKVISDSLKSNPK